MSTLPRLIGLAAAGVLTACAPAPAPLPENPVAAGPLIAVSAEAVPLNPARLEQMAVGDFVYAGGLTLSASDTSRFHGLSDLIVSPDGRLAAISDEGDRIEARLVLDSAGRLTGLSDVSLSPIAGLDGRPLGNKASSDAEGLARLGDGDELISFEREHRIWRYPADGGAPTIAPAPQAEFPANGGMEALAADPERGADAYVVGGEDSGQTWLCRLSAGCEPGPAVEKPGEFGLVALRRLPGDQTAYLLRAWDPARGNRIVLTIAGPAGEVGRLEMSRPLSVDNFEGMDFVPRPAGGYRVYLLADDNFQASQRTLLLAFDWTP